MKMEFMIATEEEKNEIFLAYYNYFVLMYGPSFGKNFVGRAIGAGDYDSKTAAFLDPAYERASEIVNNFLPSGAVLKIVGEGKTRAYFRISFMQKIDEFSAHIGEVIMPSDDTCEKEASLSDMICLIEKELRANVPDVTRVSYEAVPSDENTCVALEDNGYYHTPSKMDSRFYTIIFEKNLLEEKVSRG